MQCPRFAFFTLFCVPQAEALQKQLDRKVEEFKAKELDQDVQKKELTLVVERLLRKVNHTSGQSMDEYSYLAVRRGRRCCKGCSIRRFPYCFVCMVSSWFRFEAVSTRGIHLSASFFAPVHRRNVSRVLREG